MPTSFKPEVIADRSGKWCSNQLRFATFAEAKAYALDLAGRWPPVTDVRVVESDDPVNYTWPAVRGAERIEESLS